ncbi:MAG TPA: ATP-binding protein, partial [Gemmatimonadaceae bacterium]|nr:ATP-binding protein [Gemmatimonadaceae bacterium]
MPDAEFWSFDDAHPADLPPRPREGEERVSRSDALARTLRDSEERRRLAVEAAGIGEWDLDVRTQSLFLSPRTRELLALPAEEKVSIAAAVSRVHPADAARVRGAVRRASDPRGSGFQAVEFRIVHPNGRVIWVEARGRAAFERAADARVAVMLRGTMIDVTERKRAEGERERLLEAAEAANRAKDEFLATMSHELRTPLTAVLGYAEILADGMVGPVTPEQEDQLRRLHESGEQLLALIDGLLGFVRLQTEREIVLLERFFVDRAARQVCVVASPLADRKGLSFRCEVPDAPLEIESDPQKVRQILINLVGNAIKFTDSGEVALRMQDDGDAVLLTVSDTGVGMTPEELGKAFERFWQAERGPTRRVGGTGLGLTIAHSLATLLGASLTARSEKGQGSVFTLRLPKGQS